MITPTSTGKLPPSTDRTLLFRKLVICPYLFDICLYFLSLGVYCNKTISKAVFRGKNIQFNFLGISRTNIWNSTKGLAKAYFSQSFSTIYVCFFFQTTGFRQFVVKEHTSRFDEECAKLGGSFEGWSASFSFVDFKSTAPKSWSIWKIQKLTSFMNKKLSTDEIPENRYLRRNAIWTRKCKLVHT